MRANTIRINDDIATLLKDVVRGTGTPRARVTSTAAVAAARITPSWITADARASLGEDLG